MKTLKEKIEVMAWFDNGRRVTISDHRLSKKAVECFNPEWNWSRYDYDKIKGYEPE